MLLKNRITMLTAGILFLIFSNLSLATHSGRVEKLAEYDILSNNLFFTHPGVFKGKPISINLERDESFRLHLTLTKLVNDYTRIDTKTFDLTNIVNPDAEYELDFDHDNQYMYVLLTNNNDTVRYKKNILLRSATGNSWELYKNFPAEWELYNLEVNGNNISISCANCEDELKVSYIISNNSGQTWHKFSLSEDTNITYFSGIADNKLFIVAQSRNPDDRKHAWNQLQYRSLMNKDSKWVDANISSLISVTKKQNGKDQVFEFSDIESLNAIDNYIIAVAEYSTNPSDEKEDPVTLHINWISRDNGTTWEQFNFKNLENEELEQIEKHNGNYHLVTSKDIAFSNNDGTDEDLDPIVVFMNLLKEQKYSYYSLSQSDMNRIESFQLEPKYSIEHGIGFNIDYKNLFDKSYVDTMFIRSENDELKLEFYRQFEN